MALKTRKKDRVSIFRTTKNAKVTKFERVKSASARTFRDSVKNPKHPLFSRPFDPFVVSTSFFGIRGIAMWEVDFDFTG